MEEHPATGKHYYMKNPLFNPYLKFFSRYVI